MIKRRISKKEKKSTKKKFGENIVVEKEDEAGRNESMWRINQMHQTSLSRCRLMNNEQETTYPKKYTTINPQQDHQ